MSGSVEQIEAVLHEAEELHGQVYRIVHGDHPDWASWYADWLVNLSELPELLGTPPVRSELVYLLVRLDKEYTKEAPAEPWPSYYAPRMLEYFAGSRRSHADASTPRVQERRSPVSRTVMLSRPSGRPSPSGAVPVNTLGTPWKMRRFSPPEHEQVAAAHLDVDERPGAAVDAREAERARVAEADGHHRRAGRFLAVLVQAESGAGGIEVDDRGVGLEPGRLGTVGAVGHRHRVACEGVDADGHRLHRRAVGVVGGPRVGVGVPVPAEAHRLHAHQLAGRHAWVAQPGRRPRPRPELLGELALGRRAQPVRDVHDSRHQLPGDAGRLHAHRG